MSRPGPRPPDAAHEQHDALLLAQFAAGDPLGETRQREAQELASSCADCASLVADLRVVSSAVAWEPVPARRRDFRIAPEQADRLHGNSVTRFLRRLSLPRSRGLQPLAAGAMSLGLALVVIGYAWPEGGSVVTQGDADALPAPIERAQKVAPSAAVVLPPLETEGDVAPEAPPTEQSALSAADAGFFEELDEHQAGTSARSNQKALAPSVAESSDVDALAGAAEPFTDDVAENAVLEQDFADAVESLGAAGDLGLEAAAPATTDADGLQPGGGLEARAEADVLADDDGPEAVVVLVGLILTLGGGALLLLIWLTRRSTDPLLR